MREAFFALFDALTTRLSRDETLTAHLFAEDSNFVRFNRGKIRQPGHVVQSDCSLRLINGRRQANMDLSLTGTHSEDLRRAIEALETLRGWVSVVPEDPYLCLPESVRSTQRLGENTLPLAKTMVDDILASVREDDMVGILATGSVGRGFASSTGQRNWFTAHPFSLDWCLYLSGDKAVKTTYSGFSWEAPVLSEKMAAARSKLDILKRPNHSVKPGEYRTFLSPSAVGEIVGLCSWGGFSASATKIGMSPLKHLASGGKRLSPMVSMSENMTGAVTEDFQEGGFIRPTRLSLIEGGQLVNTLCSPRTSAEYEGLSSNRASQGESPCALDMAAGGLAQDDILAELQTGLYVSNLWYLNFSDKAAGRMTGMTRFATVWVENGEAVAPVTPMRFDETVYRALGENLVGLTAEREFDLSTSTYHRRSTNSTRLPGALINDFMFTL